MLCWPAPWICSPAVPGERGRRGGVPKRGGDWPNELDKAAARAEIPGPGKEWLGAGPANGVKLSTLSDPIVAFLFGVGICCTRGVPDRLFEGTGEARRAVEVALGTGLPDSRPRKEPGEDGIGTGNGRE